VKLKSCKGEIKMENLELFWNSSIEDMKKGYIYNEKSEDFICLICGESFKKGLIYKEEECFYEAEKFTRMHIEKNHVSVFHYLINMDKRYTGISEIQKEILYFLKENKSDKEIAEETGGSQSTIRNHRFKLREKEKQAKTYLALLSIINEEKSEDIKINKKEQLIPIHKEAAMVDERYAITEEDKEKIIKTYFDETGALKEIPAKAKKKIVVLQHIMENFKKDKQYKEIEVNRILKRINEDHVSLRRALIEYGFMDRKSDCSYYWVK
jgi:DNA-binding CsgD family transcriptional regulator